MRIMPKLRNTSLMVLRSSIGVLVVFGMWTNESLAQEEREMWQTIDLSVDVTKKWKTSLRYDLRQDLEEVTVNEMLLEWQNSLELTKWLEVDLFYRETWSYVGSDSRRFALQLKPQRRWGDWRIQGKIRLEWNSEEGETEERWRLRIRPLYRLGDHKLYAYPEWFLLNNGETDRWRFALGWELRINKRNDLGVRILSDHQDGEQNLVGRLIFSHQFN